MRTQPARASEPLIWLALPWLVLPPGTLMAASQIQPVYSFRYVIFCLPAVALLAGAGLAALGQFLRAAALALLVVLAAPAQLSLRIPGSGAGGGLQAAAQVLAAHERPGDAVIYPGPAIPPWYLAYPRAFRPLRNIGQSQPGAAIGHLYATSIPASVLIRRERDVSRIWVIDTGPPWPDPAPYLAPGFRLTRAWQPRHDQVRLALYQRTPAAHQVPDAGNHISTPDRGPPGQLAPATRRAARSSADEAPAWARSWSAGGSRRLAYRAFCRRTASSC